MTNTHTHTHTHTHKETKRTMMMKMPQQSTTITYATSYGTNVSFLTFLLLLLLLLTCQRGVESFSSVTPPSSQPSSSSSTFSSVGVGTKKVLKPYYEAEIDYSGASEFIMEYHNALPYFANPGNKVLEPIYNAREGVYNDTTHELVPPTLQSCGFTLLQHQPPTIIDWSSMSMIREYYVPEIKSIVETIYGDGTNEIIDRILFWCPTFRTYGPKTHVRHTNEQSRSMVNTPTSGYVNSAHIDTDVTCYETAEQLVNLIDKNPIESESFPMDDVIEALEDGRRFAIVNVWRNIGNDPVRRRPLGLLASKYSKSNIAFPESVLDSTTSRWYTFPEMISNEVLLFLQYDRDVRNPSDIWHCALSSIDPQTVPGRESFDMRCFIIFKENVPKEYDRWIQGRKR